MAVPIVEVIEEYTGNHPNRSGMVKCPNPEHTDENPSAKCYENSNSCHCFSCSQSFSPMDIIMLNTEVNFPEACKMLIDDFGLDVYHYSNLAEIEQELYAMEHKEYFEVFPLDLPEMRLIGFESTSYTGVITQKEIIEDEFLGMETLSRQFRTPTLKQLWDEPENREWVESMILQKAEQALSERQQLKEEIREKVVQYRLRNDQTDYALASAYINQLEQEWEQSGVPVEKKRDECFDNLREVEKLSQEKGMTVFQYLDEKHQKKDSIMEYQFLRVWHEDLLTLLKEEEQIQNVILKLQAMQETRTKDKKEIKKQRSWLEK